MTRFTVSIDPPGFAARARVERTLRAAAGALGLAARLGRVRVVVRPRPGGDDAHVRWHECGARVHVRLTIDAGNFLSRTRRRSARAARGRAAGFPARGWSEREARATLLHELSHVADALRYGIDSTRVAPRDRGPFEEAWNVWIDGRLARRGGSALSRAERFREFRRVFRATAPADGRAALPAFERLWRARRLRQRDLVRVVDSLLG